MGPIRIVKVDGDNSVPSGDDEGAATTESQILNT
jgi:hypothetical protein